MRLTNIRFFGTMLCGDSRWVVHYLGCLGYKLSPVEQTGANFGLEVLHEAPYQASVGTGTMVADGLSVANADFSSTSFRVSRASIGRHNFLGNRIAYPARSRTGDNVLLATKVMVPIDGQVRENVGLLGSPPFEIPRTVERDSRFDYLTGGEQLRRGLAAKTWRNVGGIGLYLLVRWMFIFGLAVVYSLSSILDDRIGTPAIALANVAALVFGVGYWVLVERAVLGFRTLRPMFCSIYQPGCWQVERLWKVPAMGYLHTFDGTPFKNAIWRLLGVRVGHRVFDDGCRMIDRTLVTIGNDAVLNPGSIIQPHSQEDGTYKSDHITIGARCTLGVGAFVHYGVNIGDGATLAADTFLMKGEEIPPGDRWGGNPARDMPDRFHPRIPHSTGMTSVPPR